MNAPFKINRIIADINHQKIDEKFDFFEIKTSEKYFDTGARILDDLIIEDLVKSVQFDLGNKFYVMMNHDDANEQKIKEVLKQNDKADYLSFEKVDSYKMYENQLIQLFLNGLYRSEHRKLRYNNLAGHLYCFNPNKLIHKRGDSNTIWQIPCIDVKVTWQGNLTLDVKTFSAVQALLNKCSEGEKSKIMKLPRYTLENNNTMRRSLKEDSNKLQYVMRTFGNGKQNINFLTFDSAKTFVESKMGILAEVMEKLSHDYGEFLKLNFAEIGNDYKSEEFTTKIGNENDAYVEGSLLKQPIKIIDLVKDEYSTVECEKILLMIQSKYPKVKSSIGKNFSKEALHIALIHDKEYYKRKGIADPHDKLHPGCSVQHITVEKALESLDAAFDNVIHNILIKEDLRNEKISLFNWNKMDFQERISFGLADKISENAYRYIFMDIEPDGSFKIAPLNHNLFSQNEYSKCIEIFDKVHSEKRNRTEPAKGIIKDSQGNINIIRDTELITLPEFQKIKEKLDSGDNKIRSNEYLNSYFNACTNIKMFKDNGKSYYCVGIKKKNFPTNIPRATNIREIQAYDGAPVLFEKLLPLMSVEFVRNGQLTVVPFPFKYLREWVEMNKES